MNIVLGIKHNLIAKNLKSYGLKDGKFFTNAKKISGVKEGVFRSSLSGIYKSEKEKYFIKSLPVKSASFGELQFFVNEIKVLNQLKETNSANVELPQVEEVGIHNNELYLAVKYFEGNDLDVASTNIIHTLGDALKFLTRYKIEGLRRVRLIRALALFPVYLLVTSFKTGSFTTSLRLLSKFYPSAFLGIWVENPNYLCHTDLSAGNLLENKDRLFILDFESAVTADKNLDLALIVRNFYQLTKLDYLLELVYNHTSGEKEKRLFFAFLIYSVVQGLAIYSKSNLNYKRFEKLYLDGLYDFESTLFQPKLTFFEVVNLVTFSVLSKLNAILKLGLYKKDGLVLCLHSISNHNWRFSTSVSSFEDLILELKKSYKLVTVSELVSAKNKQGLLALSFDDGYRDIFTNAFPILVKYKIRATVFAIGDPARVDRDELTNKFDLMSEAELKDLVDNGWEIGSHTLTHANLSKLDINLLRREIIDGKKQIESYLGKEVTTFAYPKGFYSRNVVKVVSEAGFTHAFTVDGMPLGIKPLLLHRVAVDGLMSTDDVLTTLTYLGLATNAIFFFILKLKDYMASLLKKSLLKLRKIFTLDLALVVFVALVLMSLLRGYVETPSSLDLNTPKWRENGPFALSPERGRFALLYSLAENQSFWYNNAVAKFATPDLGYANGRFVSLFAPGVSAILLPGYLVGKALGASQLGSFATISVFALLNFVLVFLIARRLGTPKVISYLGAFSFLFATPALAYSVNLYQHHISTFLILFSFYIYLTYEGFAAYFMTFFICALSVPVDYPNFFMLFPVGLATAFRIFRLSIEQHRVRVRFNLKHLPAFLGLIPPILFMCFFSYASYGDPFKFSGAVSAVKNIDDFGNPKSPEFENLEDIQTYLNVEELNKNERDAVGFFKSRSVLNGLYTHLLSQDRGVLFFAPVMLLAVFGIVFSFRKNQLATVVLVSIISMNVLFYSMWLDPWGGWAFGSRYLIPSYALLGVLLSITITKFSKNPILLAAFLFLFTYSAFINVVGALGSLANPPKVEVLYLEELSGVVQKYTYERNLDLLKRNNTLSFFYNSFGYKYLTVLDYAVLIHGLVTLVVVCLLVAELVSRKKHDYN